MKWILFLCAATSALHAQVAKTANENYRTEAGREGLIRGLSLPSRDATQKPADLVAGLGIRPGMIVADIGTGPGYLLPYLSAAVGPAGRVLAEDIFDDFLSAAKKKASDAGLKNLSFIKGTERSPELPTGVDVIVALDSYHHYDYPQEMLAAFRKALKPDGRLTIIEYYKRAGAIGGGDMALTHVRLDDSGVIKEVEAAGFTLLAETETIPKSQYKCVFRLAAR